MLNRRLFLKRSALLCAALRSGSVFAATGNEAEVKTGLGVLQGSVADGILSFRAVPFARPPEGPLRFRPPESPKGWAGVRDATEFAPAAMQAGNVNQSEDCLYLNVWAPQSRGPHPVFVWVHGGALTGGRSSNPMFDGSVFARDGIVCVTVAYRLGVLGFLDMEPMLGASYAGSANNGLRDVVAALEWVRDHIASFGGDPQRVTVGGLSAGAKLCDLLLGIPSAAPLFQQVISESGGSERVWSRERAQEVARNFATLWSSTHDDTAESLLSADPRSLIETQRSLIHQFATRTPLRPEIDGSFIPEAPLTAIATGASRGKRLLIGTNRDESSGFIGAQPGADATAKDLANVPLEQFQTIEEAYRRAFPGLDAPLLRIRSVTAEEYWLPTVRTAQAHVSGGGKAFFYRLDYGGHGAYADLAVHASELRFVWDRLKFFETPGAHRLAASMHGAWSSFIRGEAPQGPGVPAWPEYSVREQATMIFDDNIRVEKGPQAAELQLWDGVLTPPPHVQSPVRKGGRRKHRRAGQVSKSAS